MDLLQQIEEIRPGMSALRRELHQHPEPSLEEHWTAARIRAELDSLGIPCQAVGETGTAAFLRGEQSGEGCVILRADIDALRIPDEKSVPYRSGVDGVMHACGHDAHAASLLGAARILAANRSLFGGEIRFFFQQAEEIGQGARLFVRDGLLEGADRVFGVHVASDVPVGSVALYDGPSNASCDYFRIEVTGRAAHVSTPHKGVDALYIASQIVVGLQAIVARQTAPLDSVVVGVGKLTAGTAYNIVAEKAVLEGTTRSFTPTLREQTNRRVTETARATAALYGGEAVAEWADYAAPLINDPAVSGEVKELVTRLWGRDRLYRRPLSLGADDFADFTALVPGTYAFVGSASDACPGSSLPHHNGGFDIDEEALTTACALYVHYALDRLGKSAGS